MVLSLFLFFFRWTQNQKPTQSWVNVPWKKALNFHLKIFQPRNWTSKRETLNLRETSSVQANPNKWPITFWGSFAMFCLRHHPSWAKKTWVAIKLKPLHNMTACNPTNLTWFPTTPAVLTTKCVFIRLFFHEKKQGSQKITVWSSSTMVYKKTFLKSINIYIYIVVFGYQIWTF